MDEPGDLAVVVEALAATSTDLREIELSSVALTQHLCEALQALTPRLQTLRLANLSAGTENLRLIARLSSLQSLSITDTGVRDSDLCSFTSLASLQLLDLSGTKISNQTLFRLGEEAPRLTVLRIAACREVSTRGLAHLRVLPVEVLDLAGCEWVDDTTLSRIADLRGLRELRIASPMVQGDGLTALQDLPSLQYLDLSGCTALKSLHVLALSQCQSLRWVRFPHARVSPQARAELAEALPECVFVP